MVPSAISAMPVVERVERTLLDDIADMSEEEKTAKLREFEHEKITAMSEAEFEEHMARLYGYRDGRADPAAVSHGQSELH